MPQTAARPPRTIKRAVGADLMKPDFQLKACIFCAMPAELKIDRRGAPYLYCQHCGIRCFFNAPTGVIGLRLLHDHVLRTGPVRWRQALQQMLNRKLRAAGAR